MFGNGGFALPLCSFLLLHLPALPPTNARPPKVDRWRRSSSFSPGLVSGTLVPPRACVDRLHSAGPRAFVSRCVKGTPGVAPVFGNHERCVTSSVVKVGRLTYQMRERPRFLGRSSGTREMLLRAPPGRRGFAEDFCPEAALNALLRRSRSRLTETCHGVGKSSSLLASHFLSSPAQVSVFSICRPVAFASIPCGSSQENQFWSW